MTDILRALTSASGAVGAALATGPLLGVAVLALVALVWWMFAGPTREPVKRLSMVIRACQSGSLRATRRQGLPPDPRAAHPAPPSRPSQRLRRPAPPPAPRPQPEACELALPHAGQGRETARSGPPTSTSDQPTRQAQQ